MTPTETAKALLAKLEAMPSEGNIRLVAEAILAERQRCEHIFKEELSGMLDKIRRI